MKRRIKVSRSGLTECSACEQHIRIEPKVVETVCPFCGTPLAVAASDDALSGVRSNRSLFAASLVGIALSAGCIEEPPPENNTPNNTVAPVYGVPIDPDMGADMNADMEVDMADEPLPMPEYGLPFDPDMGDADMEVDMADEPLPMPEYGLPFDPDMGDSDMGGG